MNKANLDRKKAWKAAQKVSAKAAFPLSNDLLAEFFDFVEISIGQEGCDHSRRFTEKWLASKQIAQDPFISWLETNGGFCDCEVAGNVLQHWEENR